MIHTVEGVKKDVKEFKRWLSREKLSILNKTAEVLMIAKDKIDNKRIEATKELIKGAENDNNDTRCATNTDSNTACSI